MIQRTGWHNTRRKEMPVLQQLVWPVHSQVQQNRERQFQIQFRAQARSDITRCNRITHFSTACCSRMRLPSFHTENGGEMRNARVTSPEQISVPAVSKE